MIDVEREHLLTFAEATRRPELRNRDGSAASSAKVYRLVTAGIGGVTVEYIRLPAGFFTSIEAIRRLVERLNPHAVPPVPTPSQRRRQVDRARRELEKMGL